MTSRSLYCCCLNSGLLESDSGFLALLSCFCIISHSLALHFLAPLIAHKKTHIPLELMFLYLLLFSKILLRIIFYPTSLATAHLNKPDCPLVQLSLLTLLHTLCVIQFSAPTQAQVQHGNFFEFGLY